MTTMAVSAGIKPHSIGIGEKFLRLHWPLIGIICLVGAIGYLVLFSAGEGSHTPWAWRHGVRFVFCLCLMIALSLISIRFWFKWAYYIFGATLLLLFSVEIIGTLSNGSQRWINLGIVQIQPSELMKIALILAMARYFHSAFLHETAKPVYLIPPVLFAGVPAALVLLQPDLGTAVILLTVGGTMLFAAGVRYWKFVLLAICGGAALPVAWSQLHSYQQQRVLTFLDPERDPLGAGYHIIQSKIALGSGGVWGKGFLNGTQAQLSFLPEKQTDFAFTMLAEETGLVGAIIVLCLYYAIISIALVLAYRSTHQFGRLLAIGIGMNMFLYVMINVAMVTGLIPVVGVPLPLISYGGTAMMTVMVGFALLLSLHVNSHIHIPRFPVDM